MEDLSLRAFRDEDLGFLDRLCADPAALGEFEWFGFRDVRTWRRRWEQDGFIGPDSTALEVVLADGTLVGTTSWKVVNRGGSPGACFEIGLALLPQYRGQGLGTRGQRLLVDHLFGDGIRIVPRPLVWTRRSPAQIVRSPGLAVRP